VTKVEHKKVPVLKDGQLARVEKAAEQLSRIGDQLAAKVAAAVQPVVVVGQEITAALAKLGQRTNGQSRVPEKARLTRIQSMQTGRVTRPTIPRQVPRPAPPADGEGKALRTGALRMLEAVASRYPAPTTVAQMAQLAKMTRTGGTFGTYMSDLRTGGHIVERGDEIELTAAGWDAIGQAPGSMTPQTTEDVLSLYAGILRTGPKRMLAVLMESYPEKMSPEDLGAATDFAPSGGTFGTYLSDLRKAGLVEEEGKMIGASEYLMNPYATGQELAVR